MERKYAFLIAELKLIDHKGSFNNFPIAAMNDLKLNQSVLLSCV